MTQVSVCLATFNGRKFVQAQIESILAQLGNGDELIISDDGSNDGTIELISKIADGRIRFFRNEFRNPTRNFEFAMRKAAGELIFLSDQDDIWLDGKVRLSAELLKEHPLVVSDCVVVGEDGGVIQPSYFRAFESGPGLLRNFIRNSYLGCCMAFQRRLLQAVLPIPYGVAHDYWIGMIAELTGRPYFLAKPLVAYRRHTATASFAGGRTGRPVTTRIWSRSVLATQLATRLIDLRLRHRLHLKA